MFIVLYVFCFVFFNLNMNYSEIFLYSGNKRCGPSGMRALSVSACGCFVCVLPTRESVHLQQLY